ncbi:hypothetical protein FGU64_04570 [Mesorhizobium sp. 8]|nr:hypothetical protein [Mesorhizobium sp. 8]QDB99739.1 hypothetical protein FGU64_04570 [Mesorhizobium sp. 8]
MKFAGYRGRMKSGALTFPVAMLLIGAGGVGYFSDDLAAGAMRLKPGASCRIKGNVSINTGEHIYHVPGQEHYSETRISPEYGERWFCTEADARAAGWRRAKR